MNKFDCIVVLASQPDVKTWEFPQHVLDALDTAVKLYEDKAAKYIAISGNHACVFDRVEPKIVQPFVEADEMIKILHEKHPDIPEDAILFENKSIDTFENLYYLKNKVFRSHNLTNILFVVADYRIARLLFLTAKILGPDYKITIKAIPFANDKNIYWSGDYIWKMENHAMIVNANFLADMTPGDDSFLEPYLGDPAKHSTVLQELEAEEMASGFFNYQH